MKVKESRKIKLTKKQYLMILGALVANLTIVTPLTAVKSFASEDEVLFEDTEDDYKTEDIKEEDIVRDNTVVEPEETKQEESKQEEPKREEKKEEKKNECITEDNGYDEEAGKYWDPSIKTEPEKKGLEPEEPTPEEPTPEEPTPEQPQPTPEQPQPAPVQPAPNPTPAPTPKTGDLSIIEILELIGGLSVGSYGISSVVTNIQSRKRK